MTARLLAFARRQELKVGFVALQKLVPEMLDAARRNAAVQGLDNVEFRIADAESLPFSDGKFDRVTCRFGIMFFPDIPRAMAEIRRVLKPGGWLSLVFSNSSGAMWALVQRALHAANFVLEHVAGGYAFRASAEAAEACGRLFERPAGRGLTQAALETLAIVAYRQPVSRGQISALRGVNVDGVTRLLEQRGYIEVVGHADGPGQPALFGTTDLFLERLGLDSLAQLPAVEDFLPGPEVAGDLESEMRSALGLGVEAVNDDG